MNRCTLTNDAWCSERLWTYLQILFESLFCLITVLSMAMAQNFEVKF
jgi:hypothetical protein